MVTATLSKSLGGAGGVVAGPAAADPAPGRHRPHLHLRHRPAAGGGGRGPRRAGLTRSPAGDACGPSCAARAARGRRPAAPPPAWRSPTPAGGVISVAAPAPHEAFAWAGRLPRAGRRGGLLPPTVHAGRSVPAPADRQRRGAPAATSSTRSTSSWCADRARETDRGRPGAARCWSPAPTPAWARPWSPPRSPPPRPRPGCGWRWSNPRRPARTTDAPEVAAAGPRPATCGTLASYPDPLAPLAAARVAGQPPLALRGGARPVRGPRRRARPGARRGRRRPAGPDGYPACAPPRGRMDGRGPGRARSAPRALVVARAGLGTLNHTALTLQALRAPGVPAAVVIGAWPAEPELVHRTNLPDLAAEPGRGGAGGAGALPGGVPPGRAGLAHPGAVRRRARAAGPRTPATGPATTSASGIRNERLSGNRGACTTRARRSSGAVSATTTAASIRASCAPRQRWAPPPKARCRREPRCPGTRTRPARR